jgi:hypothetical protein
MLGFQARVVAAARDPGLAVEEVLQRRLVV